MVQYYSRVQLTRIAAKSQPTASKAEPDTKPHKLLSVAKREFHWKLILLYNGRWSWDEQKGVRTQIKLREHTAYRLGYSWSEKETSINVFSFALESCDAIIWNKQVVLRHKLNEFLSYCFSYVASFEVVCLSAFFPVLDPSILRYLTQLFLRNRLDQFDREPLRNTEWCDHPHSHSLAACIERNHSLFQKCSQLHRIKFSKGVL
jgi:hypothetical protein